MSTPKTGITRKVHALIEIPCSVCGKPHLRLGLAGVHPFTGRVSLHGEVEGGQESRCNTCERQIRDAEERVRQNLDDCMIEIGNELSLQLLAPTPKGTP